MNPDAIVRCAGHQVPDPEGPRTIGICRNCQRFQLGQRDERMKDWNHAWVAPIERCLAPYYNLHLPV